MNYEGLVSSVNIVQWTFVLDNSVTVHIGHLATHNKQQSLPEIGESIQLYNAHFKTSFNNTLERIFLCEQSRLCCDCYNKYLRDDDLLLLISNCSLGVSDLLEIEYNITAIKEFIEQLSLETSDKIIFEVIRKLALEGYCDNLNSHSCLNKIIPPFKLKTVSKCRYIDEHCSTALKPIGPPWYFGSHSKDDTYDILIGYLKVNKRNGMIMLHDCKHLMPCFITGNDLAAKKLALDQFVIIKDYRVFTEIYREVDVPNFEYVMFDIKDVIALNVEFHQLWHGTVVDILPIDFPYVYDFECTLVKKGPVRVQDSGIECWLEIHNTDSQHFSYLCLNAFQMRLIPYLHENQSYHVYHTEKLKDCKNIELQRIKPHLKLQKFTEKTAIFVPTNHSINRIHESNILSISEVLNKLKDGSSDCISFEGLLKEKKLTPALSSRTKGVTPVLGFGTPGRSTHSLVFIDDHDDEENKILLYLNNWEKLQVPLGLMINMRICVRNVLMQKNKYLKSTAMTTLEVLGYQPPVLFDTVNLCTDVDRLSDKYSYLGLGDLLPCGILIWSRPVQIIIRSLRIWCSDSSVCTSITLFVHDEMGQALVISKCVDLVRLVLGLELPQWKIWCEAFQNIGEYIYDRDEYETSSQCHDTDIFIQALSLSVKLINVSKITTTELKCRKMESSIDDNEGMPKWFCVDARHCDFLQ